MFPGTIPVPWTRALKQSGVQGFVLATLDFESPENEQSFQPFFGRISFGVPSSLALEDSVDKSPLDVASYRVEPSHLASLYPGA